jgi:selenocysteine-specific elongation factor
MVVTTSTEIRRVVVGTAGHIDHGKTALVEALTGIDCDRWGEEKARGITIDLGFAHLREGDLQLGFVDVPGHERFVHNALAGLGGIDLMVLVVAADEGIKPQTREHLSICSLLRIRAGIVALTKTDLVDEDLLELAELELAEELQRTPFGEVPIVRVSSRTGEGIDDLRRALIEKASSLEESSDRERRPTRLPLDRSFHLRGLGVLVTGTLATGGLQLQQKLSLVPSGLEARIRSIQVHGQERNSASPGERTALQLTGPSLAEVERGLQLTAPEAFTNSRRLCAELELLPDAPAAIEGLQEIRFHLYASEVLGRVRALDPPILEPGKTGIVDIRLRHPVVAARNDRFIVRRPSPQTTLGGGRILDPRWRARRGARLKAATEALSGDRQHAVQYWIRSAGEAGTETAELARRLGENSAPVEKLMMELRSDGQVIEVPAGQGHDRRWLSPETYDRIEKRARDTLRRYFERQRLAKGMPKAEAVRQICPGRAAELQTHYLDWLAAKKILVVEGDMVNLPGRGDELTREESGLSRSILDELERGGLSPPSPAEICATVGAKKQIFDGVLRFLHQRKKVARLPQGLFIAASSLEKLAEDLRATDWTSFGVGQFKDRFGLTRKWAIPLLEYLDSVGVTRRVGNERQILGSGPGRTGS